MMTRLLRLRLLSGTITFALGLTLGTTSAHAQDGPFTFKLGVGPVVPAGDLGKNFNTGFTVPVGLGFQLSENAELRAEYMFTRMNGPSVRVPLEPEAEPFDRTDTARIDSRQLLSAGTFNLVVKTSSRDPVVAYAITGLGAYRRSVKLTTQEVGFIRVCNPWWFACFDRSVAVDRVLDSVSSTDLGFNIGGGVVLGSFFAEVRYHYVRGPEFDVLEAIPAAQSPTGRVRASGHYLPFVVGVHVNF